MRAEEKLTKAQKRQVLSFFPETPLELLTEEQWLSLWDMVEPQIKRNRRDWYGRNIAYKHRTSEHITRVFRAHYKEVALTIDYCRAQNVKRKELSKKLGIELPPEFPNPVTAGFNRAQVKHHEELLDEWQQRRRMWKNIAEGRLKNTAEDLTRVSSMEVLLD